MSENAEDTTLSQLTLFAEDSPARMSVTRARGQASRKARGRDSGTSSRASFASLSLDGSWLKMCRGCYQLTLDGEWERYSETWPRAGMTRNGIAYRQPPSAPRTSVTGSSSWDTPSVADSHPRALNRTDPWFGPRQKHLQAQVYNRMWPTPAAADGGTPRTQKYIEAGYQIHLSTAVVLWPTPTASDSRGERHQESGFSDLRTVAMREKSRGAASGKLNPTWVEWLMGFPPGWTDSDA